MRKTTEKVALVALICVALVFIVATILFFCGVATPGEWTDNGFTIALLIVLGVAFVGLSIYLVYENFASRSNLRRVLLYCDSESATMASRKVVQNIVDGCSKKVDGIKIKRTRINMDDKQGLVLTLNLVTEAENMQPSMDKLRAMLFESFNETLGLKFNSINFVIDKLAKKFVPKDDIAVGESLQEENLAADQENTEEVSTTEETAATEVKTSEETKTIEEDENNESAKASEIAADVIEEVNEEKADETKSVDEIAASEEKKEELIG